MDFLKNTKLDVSVLFVVWHVLSTAIALLAASVGQDNYLDFVELALADKAHDPSVSKVLAPFGAVCVHLVTPILPFLSAKILAITPAFGI